jgi:hypothetical protein
MAIARADPRVRAAPRPTVGPGDKGDPHMGYGIGGVLILILVILAIIYFAKRV